MQEVVERFLKYVKFDTKSDEESGVTPSSEGQKVFAKELGKELENLGFTNVTVDENFYVMAEIPSNIDKEVPVVGFIAHMDTSPDMSGKDVNPKFVENYDGGDIVLNKENNIVLMPSEFPDLKNYIGKTLITTDGTTLLGADDKAGIAEIVTAMRYLIDNPQIPHGNIKVAFTPDEEIGEGANHFDVEKFNAHFAYTVDGGAIGELEYENFNAASAKVTIQGRNVHPGTAKNAMINSALIAVEFMRDLPQNEVPENTEEYEGFYHLTSIKGDVELTELSYIIRDFDKESFENRKNAIQQIANKINEKYGKELVSLKVRDQYYNMKEKVEPSKYIVDIAHEAMIDAGVIPKVTPIRGGTDGARLSFMGLPTPNFFTGGHNFHGKYEFIPVESMEKAVEVILKVVERTTKL